MTGRFSFRNYPDRSVFIIMSGTFLSQLLPLLISPFLTRIYSPEEFGMFGLYFSITMILSVFITGRYEMAVILPKSDKDAANVVGLSLLITAGLCLLIILAVLIFKHPLAILLKSEKIENWLFLLPVSMLAIGTYQTFNYWNNRKEQYTRLAFSRIARSANTSAASLALGISPAKAGGLIFGDTIGQIISGLFLFFRTWRTDKDILKQMNSAGMKEQALRYQQFPKYNVTSGLFEKMSGQMPVLMLSSLFGEAITGFFSFSQRMVSAPSAIVARAMGDVFRQKAAVEFATNGNCTALFRKTFIQLCIMSVLPFTVFYFFAPELFGLLFGDKWIVAGEYARTMTIMFFLQFITSPLSNMFLVAEKQHIDFFMQLFLLAGVVSAFLCGYNIFNDPRVCILLFTFVYSLKYMVELYLSYKFSKGTTNL